MTEPKCLTELNADQTRAEQSRPDQTRPEQTRPDQSRQDQTKLSGPFKDSWVGVGGLGADLLGALRTMRINHTHTQDPKSMEVRLPRSKDLGHNARKQHCFVTPHLRKFVTAGTSSTSPYIYIYIHDAGVLQ